MPDTVRTRSYLVTALADNTDGGITPQTVRDWLISSPLNVEALLAANNLSDIANAATALSHLGGLPLAGGTLTGDLTMYALCRLNFEDVSFTPRVVLQLYSDNNVYLNAPNAIHFRTNGVSNTNLTLNSDGTSSFSGTTTINGADYATASVVAPTQAILDITSTSGTGTAQVILNASVGDAWGFLCAGSSFAIRNETAGFYSLVCFNNKSVTTANNTLDDGTGGMSLVGGLHLNNTGYIDGLTFLQMDTIGGGSHIDMYAGKINLDSSSYIQADGAGNVTINANNPSGTVTIDAGTVSVPNGLYSLLLYYAELYRPYILSTPPASSSAAATAAGEIAWDANYLYVAVGASAWKRIALSLF